MSSASPSFYSGMPSTPHSEHLAGASRQRLLACAPCRQRKVRCDHKSPCTPCIKARFDCVPATPVQHRQRRSEHHLLARIRRYESILREKNISYDADPELSSDGGNASSVERLHRREIQMKRTVTPISESSKRITIIDSSDHIDDRNFIDNNSNMRDTQAVQGVVDPMHGVRSRCSQYSETLADKLADASGHFSNQGRKSCERSGQRRSCRTRPALLRGNERFRPNRKFASQIESYDQAVADLLGKR